MTSYKIKLTYLIFFSKMVQLSTQSFNNNVYVSDTTFKFFVFLFNIVYQGLSKETYYTVITIKITQSK